MLVLLSLSNIAQAYADDSLFIVENVKVDITAANSVIAQKNALEKAQTKAFMVLAKRMLDESEAQNIVAPSSLTISSLVKDYEITNEQLSAVRYVGTYIFRFRPAAVSKFFSASGIKFTAESSNPLLVLPIFQKGRENILWSEGNVWMEAWSQANISRGIVPIEVPIGDLMDIADIDEDQALRYERQKLDRMLARYNAKEAAIMIAIPDRNLLNGGDLRISIYRTDRLKAQHVRDLIISSNEGEAVEQIYARGVTKAYWALQKDWKNKTLSSAAQVGTYVMRIALQDLRQWVKINKVLARVNGISDILVLSMKKTEARLSFNFRGGEKRLRETLLRSNLRLGRGYNSKAHNFTHEQRDSPDTIYDLNYVNKGGKVIPKSFYQGIEPSAGERKFGVQTF